jgi:DNA uptake protein ComE-like DNA-binding protein
MKEWLRELFTFSSDERKGVIALVFVLIVICCINMLLMLHDPMPVQGRYPDWMKDTGAFEEADNKYFSARENNSFTEPMPDAGKDEVKKAVDPNYASLEELILTGFSFRVARTIITYREKGGKFRIPDDLKKIYGLTPDIFRSVEPWIKIKDMTPKPAHNSVLPEMININTADSATLEKLPGIGPVLARRITRYRAMLGGYYSPAQIMEVYGINDSLFSRNRERLEADTSYIKTINLNTCDEKELARHPYIGKYTAAGIIKYRTHKGIIMNINELTENGLIEKDRFDKVKFYLSL